MSRNIVVAIYKKIGETPLEALNRLREEKPEYKDETLSYAGRLDPMACGVMLVLVGEANKEREKYLNLPKTYHTEILFGVSTDTYDTLGMITEATDTVPDISLVEDSMRSIQGTFSQKYPEFSSKPVDGIPLHVHARSGRRVKIPTHDVTLYKVFFDGETTVSRDELVQRIVSQIRSVKGDFRQDDIVYAWEHVVNAKEYVIVEVTLEVSSGFYVRQYAHDVGMLCNTPACALSITRTKVGQFGVGDCII